VLLVHEPVPGRGVAEAGSVAPALTDLGFEVVVTTLLSAGAPGAVGPSDTALLVVLGSSDAAYDDTLPWLAAERAHVERAVALGIPVLGICFGAQLLARVLGGTVGRAPRPERGFTRIDSTDEAALPAREWLQFHDDAFTLPPGAQLLAANAVGVQAFRHGPHLGVQFHPEITPAAFDAWVESWRAAGELDRVAATTDLPALKAEIRARRTSCVQACRDLVARFVHPTGAVGNDVLMIGKP
jgi:GMP synthase (glutamine-hydrolysing)